MYEMAKKYIQKRLEGYVTQYFANHPNVRLIVVTGSVGKTSTKRAIATLLNERYKVRMHDGNQNTEMSVPFGILGIKYPENIRSISAWREVFKMAEQRVSEQGDTDIIIQELGTDKPGDVASFGRYLRPHLAVITAVTPEHMEFFGTIEEVAKEEMSVSGYSQFALINRDDVEGRFAAYEQNPNFSTYGTSGAAEYKFEIQDYDPETGYIVNVFGPEFPQAFMARIRVLGEHSLRPVAGAMAVAAKMGLTPQEVASGMTKVLPVPGRMSLLKGIGGTMVIDDSYNSSPAAAEAAMRTLYSFDQAPQRIALLGDMRELGVTSQYEHEKLGAMCDPNMVSWVVTVGPESEKYLAPRARQRGCSVKSFRSAIEAGAFVRSVSEEGGVILVKGSQNTIYLEEAVKVLVDYSEDVKLVRQTPQWVKTKSDFFSNFS